MLGGTSIAHTRCTSATSSLRWMRIGLGALGAALAPSPSPPLPATTATAAPPGGFSSRGVYGRYGGE